MNRLTGVVIALATVAGCTSSESVEIDGRDDTFTSEGKLDGFSCTAAEAAAIVNVANTATKSVLKNDVQLATKAIDNILAYRAGDDETTGTSDDGVFGSLSELDAVPYIGPVAFNKLLDYVHDADLVDDTTLQGVWTSSTIANGEYVSFALTPSGKPVVALHGGAASRIMMPDGDIVDLAADGYQLQVAVDGNEIVHAFYHPVFSQPSWAHVTYENGTWVQHNPITTNELRVDQGPDGQIAALGIHKTLNSSRDYSLVTFDASGTSTSEPLWNGSGVFFNVDDEGLPNVMWTDGYVRTARRTSAGWQTRATGHQAYSEEMFASTGGATPSVFFKYYNVNGNNGITSLRTQGSGFVQMPVQFFGSSYRSIDAALDAQGNTHLCVVADGDVYDARIDAAGSVTTQAIGAAESCWLGKDANGTLHMMYTLGNIVNHATYE